MPRGDHAGGNGVARADIIERHRLRLLSVIAGLDPATPIKGARRFLFEVLRVAGTDDRLRSDKRGRRVKPGDDAQDESRSVVRGTL